MIFCSIFIRCNDNNRNEWSNEIEKHHPFNISSYFSVCIRHFKETDYSKKNENLFKLNANAIPTVFEITYPSKNAADTAVEFNDDCFDHLIVCDDGTEVVINTSSRNEEVSLNAIKSNDILVIEKSDEYSLNATKSQIDQLKTELINLKLTHDVEIQTFKKKIQNMEDIYEEKSTKLQQAMSQLRGEKSKNVRLEALNIELRTSHLQSTNGITNVNVNFCIHCNLNILIIPNHSYTSTKSNSF